MSDTPPPDAANQSFTEQINFTAPRSVQATWSTGKATWSLGKKATTPDPYDNLVRHLAAAEEERWKLHADLDALGVIFGRPLYLAIAEHTDNLSEHIAEAQDEAERLLADREGRLAAERARSEAYRMEVRTTAALANEWAEKATEARREVQELRKRYEVGCEIVEPDDGEACVEPDGSAAFFEMLEQFRPTSTEADAVALLDELRRHYGTRQYP